MSLAFGWLFVAGCIAGLFVLTYHLGHVVGRERGYAEGVTRRVELDRLLESNRIDY